MAQGHAQEPGQGGDVGAEATCQRCAGHGSDLPNPLHSEPVKSVDGRDRQAKGRYRQFGDGCRHTAGHDDALGPMSGHSPCGAGRVRDGGARAYPGPTKAACKVTQKRLFTTEEVAGPGDLNPNTVWAIGRDKRAVAHAPCCEPA
jgi:hypothetical protein